MTLIQQNTFSISIFYYPKMHNNEKAAQSQGGPTH